VALTNAYCTLQEVKNALAIEDPQDDLAIEAAIMATSRMIDDYTGRFFYQDGSQASPVVRFFTAKDWWTTNVDDIIYISEIATDDNFDQLYTTVWATSDYMIEPVNNPRRGWPWTRLLAIGSYIFPSNLPQSVRVTGVWGWTAIPEEVKMACRLQAARFFVRRQSPFGIAGSPEIGTVRLSSRLDPDVELLLKPFRKVSWMAH
jgi:hypothetical protein